MKSREEVKAELKRAIEGLDEWEIVDKVEELVEIVNQKTDEDGTFWSLLDTVYWLKSEVEWQEYFANTKEDVLSAVERLKEILDEK